MAKESRINIHAFKKNVTTTVNVLHIATELVNTPTEPNLTALIFLS